MRSPVKLLIAFTAAVRALALVVTPISAVAGEYCLTNSSGIRGCGFATLQQCLDSVSGTSGTCARDPFYRDPASALAYQPKAGHSHGKNDRIR
jgi:Protein of unknown function (DUF3551)